MDFCASPPSATWWCLLQCRQGGGGRSAGATAAGLAGLAAAWMVPWLVLVWWMVAGRFGALPRRRRLELPDLEDEGQLGAVPRPAHHSDRWASRCSFWWFTKPDSAMELLLPRFCWFRCFLLRCLSPETNGGCVAGDAELLQGLGCISRFFGGFFAFCTSLRSFWTYLFAV